MMMNDYYEQFISEQCNRCSIIIENDGKVCYGYLLIDNNIVGDVPAQYARDAFEVLVIRKDGEIDVEWVFADGTYRLEQVKIFIRGRLAAILMENSKPGWSINAKKDGPLAKVLL